MGARFKNLKKSLQDLEEDSGLMHSSSLRRKSKTSKGRKFVQYILLAAFIITFLFYAGRQFDVAPSLPFQEMISGIGGPSQSVLEGMGTMLEDMGYGRLTNEELTELRSEGVTATYVSRVRSLGFEDLSLEDAVRLQQAGVSSTFIAMMQELGYRDLTIDDFIRLRRSGVTAHFTSNMHDLGYQNLEMEELIRLREIGVTASLVRTLQANSEGELTLEEIIRHRISNQ